MAQHLFAYGTLQPGLIPEELALLMQTMPVVGRGSIGGVLHDLGSYPGAIIDEDAETRIHGTIYSLTDDPDVLAELDAYEEFEAQAPAESLFLREEHPVEVDDGGTLRCWVYVLGRVPDGAPILRSGVFERLRG